MKQMLFLLACGLLLACCQSQNSYQVKFCNQLDGSECVGQDSLFDFNKTVYVQLVSQQAIPHDSIQGSIFGLLPERVEGRFMFANRVFVLEPGQEQVDHDIPFGRFGSFGNYEIEFSDMKGNVLATGQMRIRRPDEAAPAP